MPIIESQFITVDGNKLEYVWHGLPPNKAPTLIFLHEGLGCTALWRNFPAKLAEATNCGAFVYSRLGYGESDPCRLPRPARYMHDEALHVLPQVLEAMEIQDCILIGHSDGGSIAIIYTGGTAAQSVRGIITEAAHVFCETLSVESIAAVRETYRHTDLRQKLMKYHGDNVDNAFWGWNDVWLHPDFMEWNIEEYLPHIQVPFLAIQGEDDQYGTMAQVKAIAHQAGAGAEVVMLPNCQHNPHREQEAATLQLMTDFVIKILDHELRIIQR